MKKIFVLLILSVFAVSAFATLEDGRLSYRKNCMECHGDGKKGAFMSTQDGWVKLFDSDAKGLRKKHENTKFKSFFDSDEYKKTGKNMFEFLREYASDSGNVAGCGNSCE